MKKPIVISLSMIVLAMAGVASSASAQEKTSAEVRQELIQAENNGLNFVTDTSYPDVDPIYAVQLAHLKQQSNSGSGPAMTGSSESGKAGIAMPARTDSSS